MSKLQFRATIDGETVSGMMKEFNQDLVKAEIGRLQRLESALEREIAQLASGTKRNEVSGELLDPVKNAEYKAKTDQAKAAKASHEMLDKEWKSFRKGDADYKAMLADPANGRTVLLEAGQDVVPLFIDDQGGVKVLNNGKGIDVSQALGDLKAQESSEKKVAPVARLTAAELTL